MSVRAHRVNEIIRAEGPSFNLWHDEKLVDFLEGHGLFNTLNEGSGFTELPVEVIEEAIEKAEDLEIDEYVLKSLKEDVEFAKKNGDSYITYDCF